MLTFSQALRLLGVYARDRLFAQVKAVGPIVAYLILFQTLVLGIPVAEAGVIALGLGLVVVGLAFFMEGLLLGLMPLGETIGLKLPERSGLVAILAFAFILGVGSTFAEPAIGVLRAAGAAIRPWDAPLLFLILDQYADWLVYSVGIGVGIAVVIGMLRFLNDWSLKPFIFVLVPLAALLTLWCQFDPNLVHVVGLAWDSGAVTTGPVTVPLVLALGIGVSRVVSAGEGESQGFGVVTLASLVPIIAVLGLALLLQSRAPAPMTEEAFFSPENRETALALFEGDAERFHGYAFQHGSDASQRRLFDNADAMAAKLAAYGADPALRVQAFGSEGAFRDWLENRADAGQRRLLAESAEAGGAPTGITSRVGPSISAAVQAILPLTLFLVVVLRLFLRFRLPRLDEVLLGIGFAVAGMSLFNLGIDLGLARLGDQVGGKLPAAFNQIALPEERQTIAPFDPSVVQRAVGAEGETIEFFFAQRERTIVPLTYEASHYDAESGEYSYLPRLGPLFGSDGEPLAGIAVVLLFAFIMGYAATLAEPALNALGMTVEQITAGSFRKTLLMQAVAVGVGLGILLGMAKIVWNLPLAWLVIPPYALLMLLTALSSEEFVNIGWDSAGVTTGPITVPLVLALGLGIGGQAGVVEGFGVLAMASVCPILSVLLVGLVVTRRHRNELAIRSADDPAATPVAEAAR